MSKLQTWCRGLIDMYISSSPAISKSHPLTASRDGDEV